VVPLPQPIIPGCFLLQGLAHYAVYAVRQLVLASAATFPGALLVLPICPFSSISKGSNSIMNLQLHMYQLIDQLLPNCCALQICRTFRLRITIPSSTQRSGRRISSGGRFRDGYEDDVRFTKLKLFNAGDFYAPGRIALRMSAWQLRRPCIDMLSLDAFIHNRFRKW
jgi:hypothetical protein